MPGVEFLMWHRDSALDTGTRAEHLWPTPRQEQPSIKKTSASNVKRRLPLLESDAADEPTLNGT
jgi:hypothetical protein